MIQQSFIVLFITTDIDYSLYTLLCILDLIELSQLKDSM